MLKMLIGFHCKRCLDKKGIQKITFLSTLCNKCKKEIEQEIYNIAKELNKWLINNDDKRRNKRIKKRIR